jgi:hypothetical protein
MMGKSGSAGAFYGDRNNGAKGGGVGFIAEQGPGKDSRPTCTSGTTQRWDVRGMPAALDRACRSIGL